MKIQYVGPHASVVIAKTGETALRGEPVEVEPRLARALLQQATWEKATSKPKATETEEKE